MMIRANKNMWPTLYTLIAIKWAIISAILLYQKTGCSLSNFYANNNQLRDSKNNTINT